MSLRKLRIECQCAAAVVFRLLQPSALRVEFQVDVHRDRGQRGMRQYKFRVTRDCSGQVFDSALERFRRSE
jgi:hypothetical protein